MHRLQGVNALLTFDGRQEEGWLVDNKEHLNGMVEQRHQTNLREPVKCK